MEHPDTYPFPDTISPEPWTESAACRSVDPEIWFPEPHRQTAGQARAICSECPVKAECLQAALDASGTTYGVWGGLTEREIRRLKQSIKRHDKPGCSIGDCVKTVHGKGLCKWHYNRMVRPKYVAS